MNRKLVVSVVTPCFNEELNLEDCYRRVKDVFASSLTNYDYEHIFLDNGSRDKTREILKILALEDKRVKVIFNSRNFGPFKSMFNGLRATTGDLVIPFLPADCQDPPEVIPQLIAEWEKGFKVVFGIRTLRRESRVLRASRSIYYRAVGKMANIEMPKNAGEFALLERKVVEIIKDVDDYYPYLRGLIAYIGFPSSKVEYRWGNRKHGISRNNFFNLIDQALNGAISFSVLPMRLVMLMGGLIAFASLIYAFYILLAFFFSSGEEVPSGIQAALFGIYFLAGFTLLSLGVVGEYIGAIHSQVRSRPIVVEEERLNFD